MAPTLCKATHLLTQIQRECAHNDLILGSISEKYDPGNENYYTPHIFSHVHGPLGPLGFNFAQHSPTTRRSVEGIL
jgi:hypothetical protein